MFDVYYCLLPVSVGFSRSYSDTLSCVHSFPASYTSNALKAKPPTVSALLPLTVCSNHPAPVSV